MKTILCFGDSNTYGESPEGFGRYQRAERWPGILREALGPAYDVIEEGCNGRTTIWEDPVEGNESGLNHLGGCLKSHAPLDLVILMLGTNDLKARFSVTPADIALSVERLVRTIFATPNERRQRPPQVLLASPTFVRPTTFLGEVFGNRYEDSLRLGPLYAQAAMRCGAAFIDVAKVSPPSELDGLHFDRDGHRLVAHAMEQKVRAMLEDEGGAPL